MTILQIVDEWLKGFDSLGNPFREDPVDWPALVEMVSSLSEEALANDARAIEFETKVDDLKFDVRSHQQDMQLMEKRIAELEAELEAAGARLGSLRFAVRSAVEADEELDP